MALIEILFIKFPGKTHFWLLFPFDAPGILKKDGRSFSSSSSPSSPPPPPPPPPLPKNILKRSMGLLEVPPPPVYNKRIMSK